MHLISFIEQELSEIGTILTGYSGNKRDLIRHRFFSSYAKSHANNNLRVLMPLSSTP
jgi:hypothetical protein